MSVSRLLVAPAGWAPDLGFQAPPDGFAVAVDARGARVEAGSPAALEGRFPEAVREEGEGVLLPGLVDCHAHLELAALAEQVPGGGGLAAWVGRLLPVRSRYSSEALETAALAAAKEMRALGTVAVADVCTLLATAPLLQEAGLLGVSLLEVVGAERQAAQAAEADAARRLAAHPPTETVDVRVVPHSVHGTHPDVLRRLVVAGRGVRSIHVAEHEDEEAWLQRGEGPFARFLRSKGAEPPGLSGVRAAEALGAIGAESLLVHLVTASEAELARAAARGATAVLCPSSNLHIGNALPDLRAVRRAGIPWTLGTDSRASSPGHDLLQEVRVLAEAFPELPADELLRAATTGGAAALGLPYHPWVRITGARARFIEALLGREAEPRRAAPPLSPASESMRPVARSVGKRGPACTDLPSSAGGSGAGERGGMQGGRTPLPGLLSWGHASEARP